MEHGQPWRAEARVWDRGGWPSVEKETGVWRPFSEANKGGESVVDMHWPRGEGIPTQVLQTQALCDLLPPPHLKILQMSLIGHTSTMTL